MTEHGGWVNWRCRKINIITILILKAEYKAFAVIKKCEKSKIPPEILSETVRLLCTFLLPLPTSTSSEPLHASISRIKFGTSKI